jgi:hypothetical protein
MKRKNDTKSIFFWIIVISLSIILSNYLRVSLFFEWTLLNMVFFYIYAIILLLWGAVSGLSHKEKNRFVIIKHSFLILSISMTIIILVGSMWAHAVDPSERFGYLEGLSWMITFFTIPVFSLMFGFFVSGYIIAFFVKMVGNIFKK